LEKGKIKAAVEAVIFACGTPVETQRIAQALDISTDEAAKICEQLMSEYANAERGIRIVSSMTAFRCVQSRNLPRLYGQFST
jgi:chromosome segregation and condensation protein ScpB